jgi:hypothetical protein
MKIKIWHYDPYLECYLTAGIAETAFATCPPLGYFLYRACVLSGMDPVFNTEKLPGERYEQRPHVKRYTKVGDRLELHNGRTFEVTELGFHEIDLPELPCAVCGQPVPRWNDAVDLRRYLDYEWRAHYDLKEQIGATHLLPVPGCGSGSCMARYIMEDPKTPEAANEARIIRWAYELLLGVKPVPPKEVIC